MFRPFVGEIITARLKESTVDGLRCKLQLLTCSGFFSEFSFISASMTIVMILHKHENSTERVIFIHEYQ